MNIEQGVPRKLHHWKFLAGHWMFSQHFIMQSSCSENHHGSGNCEATSMTRSISDTHSLHAACQAWQADRILTPDQAMRAQASVDAARGVTAQYDGRVAQAERAARTWPLAKRAERRSEPVYS